MAGSSRGWVTTLNGMLTLDFDTAIPGHGAVMDRRDVLNFRNQMEDIRAHMAALIRSGTRSRGSTGYPEPGPELDPESPNGLFMSRSVPKFYDEIRAEME